MAKSVLRIGEMARLLGVTPKTVRHYHKLGLIPEPERSEGGYRLYATADLFHLQRIRRLQALGLSLQQIRFILDADDPDSLLRLTLEGLQSELAAQQRRIEERRQRIEHYLAEGASLAVVEQPDSPSPTYQLLAQKLLGGLEIQQSLADFDKQVFGQLDAFNWGDDYAAGWQVIAGYFENHTELYQEFTQVFQKMILLQTLPEDDPQVQLWADAFKQSELLQTLSKGVPGFNQPDMLLVEAMDHIFMQSADQHLSPAQRRFLKLLIS
ncbi:MAG: MerR family transcriptional regulator [Anaerolineae bacterium]|nr:MerR family transcriptional regulator [Anaerolineae bacterium]